MRTIVAFLALAAALAGAAGRTQAAEQTLLGRTLAVKDPTGANEKRKIVAMAKEIGSGETLVGDPPLACASGGAELEISTARTNWRGISNIRRACTPATKIAGSSGSPACRRAASTTRWGSGRVTSWCG